MEQNQITFILIRVKEANQLACHLSNVLITNARFKTFFFCSYCSFPTISCLFSLFIHHALSSWFIAHSFCYRSWNWNQFNLKRIIRVLISKWILFLTMIRLSMMKIHILGTQIYTCPGERSHSPLLKSRNPSAWPVLAGPYVVPHQKVLRVLCLVSTDFLGSVAEWPPSVPLTQVFTFLHL